MESFEYHLQQFDDEIRRESLLREICLQAKEDEMGGPKVLKSYHLVQKKDHVKNTESDTRDPRGRSQLDDRPL